MPAVTGRVCDNNFVSRFHHHPVDKHESQFRSEYTVPTYATQTILWVALSVSIEVIKHKNVCFDTSSRKTRVEKLKSRKSCWSIYRWLSTIPVRKINTSYSLTHNKIGWDAFTIYWQVCRNSHLQSFIVINGNFTIHICGSNETLWASQWVSVSKAPLYTTWFWKHTCRCSQLLFLPLALIVHNV